MQYTYTYIGRERFLLFMLLKFSSFVSTIQNVGKETNWTFLKSSSSRPDFVELSWDLSCEQVGHFWFEPIFEF